MLDALILGSITGIGVVAWLSASFRRLDRQQTELADDLDELGADDGDDLFPLQAKGGGDMRGVRQLIVRAKRLFDADRVEDCRAALERAIERIEAAQDRRFAAALECGFEDRHDDLEGK